MISVLRDYYAYWCVLLLLAIGLYGMLLKRNLVKKLIGMSIFQSAIILFFIVSAYKWEATVPVVDEAISPQDPTRYIDPLPHTLMLTAIVVGVATTGVALALIISIFRRYRTLDERALLERLK